MDAELIVYIVLAIIFIITSAFRGKKKYTQEQELLENQQAEEMEYIQQMMQGDKPRETDKKKAEEEPEEEADETPYATASSAETASPEINSVKRTIASKKKKDILDLRKAVIYQTILERKHFRP